MEIIILAIITCYFLGTCAYFAFLILQKDRFYRLGFILMAAGFVFHTGSIFYKAFDSGFFPAHNFHEVMSFAGWAVVGVFLIFNARIKLKILGIYAAPLATFIMAVCYRLPDEIVRTKGVLSSFWTALHVVIIFLGEASFALACGVGVLYLLQERAIKRKRRGFFFSRLPSLNLLDSSGYAFIIAGFTLLTIGLAIGFIYANAIWGRFWSGDPKEVWSAITWLVYAALLHERLAVGWQGRKAAVMSIIGFAFILFTFFGVNFLMEGHHGEFTKR